MSCIKYHWLMERELLIYLARHSISLKTYICVGLVLMVDIVTHNAKDQTKMREKYYSDEKKF